MKQYLSLLFFILLQYQVAAQDIPPCYDFNVRGVGNWTFVGCFENRVDSDIVNPLDRSRGISIKDNHGSSTFENAYDYQNLGKRFPGQCISFDYNVRNDGRSDSVTAIHPTLYVSDVMGRTISFPAYTTVIEGSQWVHVVAPIALTNPSTGETPANEYGQWTAYGGPEDFDYIMNNSVKIFFRIDIIGSDVTTEDIRLDNICVGPCKDTLSKICNSNFLFTLTKSTEPGSLLNNTGNISLLDYHSNSTYEYEWDPSYKTKGPVGYKYEPGNYTVKVSEFTKAGAYCSSMLDICVTNIKPTKKTTATDTGCGVQFNLTLTSATYWQAEKNNLGQIYKKWDVPGSTFKYEWGGSLPEYTYKEHHYTKGSYTACVTETKADRSICKNCLSLCVVDPNPKTTGIPELAIIDANSFRLMPNPATDKVELMFDLNETSELSAQVFDMMGKMLTAIPPANYSSGAQKMIINTSGFNAGIYMVRLAAGTSVLYQKLSVLR